MKKRTRMSPNKNGQVSPNKNGQGEATDSEARAWRRRTVRDFIVAGAVVCGGGLLFVNIDAVERLYPAALAWEFAEVDDLSLTLFLMVAMAGWFSYRRWRDSTSQLAALQASSGERARYLRRVEELSSQLLDVEERERSRLADVLHDEVGQTLYACQLKLELLAGLVHDERGRVLAGQIAELTTTAMTRARDLSMQLSPPALHDLGIAAALDTTLARLQERFGVTMQLTGGTAWGQVPQRCAGPVFHSLVELAINAAKHAEASLIELSAEETGDDRLKIVVRDDGRGFERPTVKGRGFGLFRVERRLGCINGAFELLSAPNRGTTAILHLPLGRLS